MKNINSQVKIARIDNEKCIEKAFNKKDKERYLKERDFYLFCNKHGIQHIPQLFHFNNITQTLHIEIIQTSQCDNKKNFEPAIIKLIKSLQEADFKYYPHYANEAVTSEIDIIRYIKSRYKKIKKSTFDLNVTGMSNTLLNSLFNKAISYENKINHESFHLIPSPSDIGKHNFLKTSTTYFFIDFEYAGLDSCLKIIYDYVLHPKNHIKPNMHEIKINSLFKKLDPKRQFENKIYVLFTIWWIFRLIQSLSNEVIKDRRDKGILNGYNINKYISERRNNILFFHNLLSRNSIDA
jgi:thiamine kinase-like enzyme